MHHLLRHAPLRLICAAFLAVAPGAQAADDKKPATARPALAVTTIKPTVGEFEVRLQANGNIAAWQEAIVGAEVAGLRLAEVRANVGDTVKRGDVLAVFSVETLEADLARDAAAVAEAEASAADASAREARGEKLVAAGAISSQEIGQLRAGAQAAAARVAAARATLDAARVRVRQARVVAPDDGVISARTATVGGVAQPGQELFRLIRDHRLEWRAEVTAVDLSRVKPGQPVTVFLPGGGKAAGRVRMLAPTVDPQTRNALVYVDLPGRGEARAGMYARGEFDLGRSRAITVPQQALVVRDGFSYVFTVGAGNRVSQLRVKTGRRELDRVEIVEGLSADVPVVSAGAGFLNDGDLVSIAAAPVSPPAAAPGK
jgi:RND family efflux transporter MFP subunit